MNTVFARTHQIWLICVAALLFGCKSNPQHTNTASLQSRSAPVANIQINDPKPYPFRFVAYRDMRFAEHDSYVKVIANSKARQQIINQIAKEVPAFLVVTGDFVFRGFHAEDWSKFDQAIKPLRDAKVPIFPAVGNHEVGPFPSGLWGTDALKEIENVDHSRLNFQMMKLVSKGENVTFEPRDSFSMDTTVR